MILRATGFKVRLLKQFRMNKETVCIYRQTDGGVGQLRLPTENNKIMNKERDAYKERGRGEGQH